VSRYKKPRFFAKLLASELFPAPDGPSIAIEMGEMGEHKHELELILKLRFLKIITQYRYLNNNTIFICECKAILNKRFVNLM